MATSLNPAKRNKVYTHQGAPVIKVSAKEELTRSVCAGLLWEDSFYESGMSIADRIMDLVGQVEPEFVVELAERARNELNMRHMPLLLARELARYPKSRHLLAHLLPNIIKRADELAEFMAIYWKEGKIPIANSVRKGLGQAFNQFGEYHFAKYNRAKDIKLRDVLRVIHPVPKDEAQSELFKKIKEGRLSTPYTWETEISKSNDKKKSWTELLTSKSLGSLALLRNLRNIQSAGVDRSLIKKSILDANTDKILPFRFITAAKHNPHLSADLENLMLKNLKEDEKFTGRTLLLADVSGSMSRLVSPKSQISRAEASGGLAIITRELCEDVSVYSFGSWLYSVPNRRGFALSDLLEARNECTALGSAVRELYEIEKFDRIIVFTDEQSSDPLPPALTGKKSYIVNVSNEQNGVGYDSGWVHVHGWSSSVVSYIQEYEKTGFSNEWKAH